jgi:hypothetical protein
MRGEANNRSPAAENAYSGVASLIRAVPRIGRRRRDGSRSKRESSINGCIPQQEATMRGWLTVLPAEVVRVRPVLTVGFAGALLLAGEVEGVEGWLRDAEPSFRMCVLAGAPAG